MRKHIIRKSRGTSKNWSLRFAKCWKIYIDECNGRSKSYVHFCDTRSHKTYSNMVRCVSYERSHTLLTVILRVGTCENQTNRLVLRCCVTLQVLSYLDRDILKSYHALTVRRMQLMCCINFSESYVVFEREAREI